MHLITPGMSGSSVHDRGEAGGTACEPWVRVPLTDDRPYSRWQVRLLVADQLRERGFVADRIQVGVGLRGMAKLLRHLDGAREIHDRGRRLSDVVQAAASPVGEHLVAAYDSAVGSSLTVRSARVEDVAQMARVNVRSWQETYRGLMSDAVLDDPGFLAARERFWTAALTDERYRENRAAVAERDGELIGIAMSGPPLDAAAAWTRQLYVLYVDAADHGTGAGRALLEAVIDPAESAALWVADPNPRAQAFYRRHGFVADGTAQVEDGVREIRMVRDVQHRR